MPHLTGIFGDEASGLRERGTQMTPTLSRDSSLFFQEADHIHVLVALLRGVSSCPRLRDVQASGFSPPPSRSLRAAEVE